MPGWVAVTTTVVAWDAYALLTSRPTMSAVFWRWLDRPWSRVICILVWFALTVHLFALRWPR